VNFVFSVSGFTGIHNAVKCAYYLVVILRFVIWYNTIVHGVRNVLQVQFLPGCSCCITVTLWFVMLINDDDDEW